MAEGHYGFDKAFKAYGDLSSYQYHFMSLSSSGTVNLSSENGRAIGILQNKPDAAGEAAIVRLLGVSKLVIAEAIDEGTMLTSSSTTGHGEEADAASEWYSAIAIQSGAGTSGELISVLLRHGDSYAADTTEPTA
jgi:hypothetical protein